MAGASSSSRVPLLALLALLAAGVCAEAPSPPVSSPSKLPSSKVSKPKLAGVGGPASATDVVDRADEDDAAEDDDTDASQADDTDDGEAVDAVGSPAADDNSFLGRIGRLFAPKAASDPEDEAGFEGAKPKQSVLMMFIMVAARMIITLAMSYFRKKRPTGVDEVIQSVGVEEGVSGDASADLASAAAGAARAASAHKAATAAANAAGSAAAEAAPLPSVMQALASGGVVAAARAAWAKLAAFARSPNAAPVMMVLLIITMKLVARMDSDGQPLEMEPAGEGGAGAEGEPEEEGEKAAAGGHAEGQEEEEEAVEAAAVVGAGTSARVDGGNATEVSGAAGQAGDEDEGGDML